MRQKKTYVGCARLLPYQRQCQDCSHKNCALRNKIDWNKEHALIEFADDQRDRIKESVVLGIDEGK